MSDKDREDVWNEGIAAVGAEQVASTPRSQDPSRDILYDLAREALQEKRRSRRWSLFFRFLLLALLLLGLLAVVFSSLSGVPGSDPRHTAVVEIKGLIADGQAANAESTVSALQQALANRHSAGLILRINSPGGSPVQSGIIFEEILRLRIKYPEKPIHAVVSDMAASGGYYIAAAADRIYANQASIVGSIGVRMDSFGFTGTLEKLGIERRLLTAGENKGMLDPFLPSNAAQTAHLQGLLDNIHVQFVTAVRKGRGERLNETDDMFSGLFWTGERALELGLVDALSTERAVARDIIGAERRIDYTYHEGLAERLLGRVSSSMSARFMSFLVAPAGPL